jgi:hypothetical protein
MFVNKAKYDKLVKDYHSVKRNFDKLVKMIDSLYCFDWFKHTVMNYIDSDLSSDQVREIALQARSNEEDNYQKKYLEEREMRRRLEREYKAEIESLEKVIESQMHLIKYTNKEDTFEPPVSRMQINS